MSTKGELWALRLAALKNADVLTEGYMCNCQVPVFYSTMRSAPPLEHCIRNCSTVDAHPYL